MLTIAVDGYSSSGKGAVCTRLARKLGIIHFETGAIYRLLGVYVTENNIDPRDKDAVVSALKDINVSLEHDNGKQITILNGENITDKLHTSEISDVCSIISPYPECRDFVTNIQRSMAKQYSLIMEGRDITSHVLPDADFKFFLDAELDVRAKRRYDEFISNGENVTFEQVKEDLRERDRRDIERELCPLILREGTIHIDNSYMSLDDEVELMYKIIKGEVK